MRNPLKNIDDGEPAKIVVVGLGYVGLPLVVALAKAHPDAELVGFDIDCDRIAELRTGADRTREVASDELAGSSIRFTDRDEDCESADIIVVAVPTPVDAGNRPDLTLLLNAAGRLAGWLDASRRPTIVFESTVYPGATEDECGSLIEEVSGLERGRDFRLGYSPERINPGDPVHRIDKIVKVIAGEDQQVTGQLEYLYGRMTEGGVFRAASIKSAEAAKAIENAQRDINIAFMNEVAQILSRSGLSVWDVLDAARTKWNFLPFEPGLVGGHCIGVDPYYLSHHAQQLGHHPEVILAGRGINDGMGQWLGDRIHTAIGPDPRRILFLGLTFKEDVPDVRNSRSIDVISRLFSMGHEIVASDPLADAEKVRQEYNLEIAREPEGKFDCVVVAVRHREYIDMTAEQICGLLSPGGVVADLKGIWRGLQLPAEFRRWSL